MSYYVDTRTKRSTGLRPGRGGISARAVSGSRGQTIPIDSFPGFDGLPASFPYGRVIGQKKRKSRRKTNERTWVKMPRVHRYPVTLIYVLTLLICGTYFQGWLGWIAN